MKRVSPHVTIYKFPTTAISSIGNRITGLGLSGGFVGLGIGLLFGLSPENTYNNASPLTKHVINYSVLFPTTYHTFGGIRHILWDKYPQLLTNNQVKKSSIALIGISALSTVIAEQLLIKDK